jgi:glycerol kinase
MKPSFILAVDQGTTNTKVLLVDRTGRIVARSSRPLEITFPQPAWVEQDAMSLWQSVREGIDECLAAAQDPEVAAIGISNQRESVVVWDRPTGRPLAPCVVWQCRRSAAFCQELRERGLEPVLHERTGLGLDPLFSASKMRWLLENIPEGRRRAEQGDICLGTVDSWVAWNLTGGLAHVTDASNASRTQLLNLRKVEWDEELLRLFGVPRPALPAIRPSSAVVGQSVAMGRLPAGIPVASLIGDSHAALFGHAAFHPGSIKATYGTGTSLMTLTDRPVFSRQGLSTTIAWWVGEQASYGLEGNILVTGGAVQWLGELLGLPNPAADAAALAEQAQDPGGIYVVPAFVGLGAPYWRPDARGLITGLTRGTTLAQLARATVESIAYQVRDVFESMQAETAVDLPELMADGGASRNDALMQFQADILGRPLVRNLSADLSAVGAAWLAGVAVGLWASLEELEALPRAEDRFEPRMPESERQARWAGWQEAVWRTLAQKPQSAPRQAGGHSDVQS